MTRVLNKQCPYCNKPFVARRKNQEYCTIECRIDANNEKAKEKYDIYKAKLPLLEKAITEVKILNDHLDKATIVITGVKEIDHETIVYDSVAYKRGSKADKLLVGIMLKKGGSVQLPNGRILYRSVNAAHYDDNGWEYIPTR